MAKKMNRDDLQRQHHPDAITARLDRGAGPQTVPDAVLGGIDGCITTFAVVSGAVGAQFPVAVALVLGFANLIADGFSMAVSNYEAGKAKRELIDGMRRREEEHIAVVPEGEREEIRQIFRRKGFEGEALEHIVDTITRDSGLWIDTMLTEEHGVQKEAVDPLRSALATFAAFIAAGMIPLLPLLVAPWSLQQKFLVSAALAGAVFFLIGMLKSLAFSRPLIRSGLGTLLTGGTAASLAYLTGYLLREVAGVA